MIAMADGDGRYVLTLAETLFNIAAPTPLSTTELAGVLQKRSPAYDKDREEHYNLISALHKSVRGSDPDAALYWLARMLAAARIRCSSPGGWCAWPARISARPTPTSLILAIAAKDAYDSWAAPEGELRWRRSACTWPRRRSPPPSTPRSAPPSRMAKETGSLMPPAHIRNAPNG